VPSWPRPQDADDRPATPDLRNLPAPRTSLPRNSSSSCSFGHGQQLLGQRLELSLLLELALLLAEDLVLPQVRELVLELVASYSLSYVGSRACRPHRP
jgi:hypothetical protein